MSLPQSILVITNNDLTQHVIDPKRKLIPNSTKRTVEQSTFTVAIDNYEHCL